MNTDAIRARFNGADMTFRIHREDLSYFEAGHGSAYGLYRRIIAGHWTVDDLASVLRFSLGPRPQLSENENPELLKMRAVLSHIRRKSGAKPDAVDAAFAAKGPGTYAPLAAATLLAALTGIPEAEAHFTDEDGEAE